MKYKNYYILFSLCLLAFAGYSQCPGPAVRTALINLQKANEVNGTRWGQMVLTDTCGNQRYVTLDSVIVIVKDSLQADTNLLRNLYNSNDTTTELGRAPFVLRTIWWRTVDSLGFYRWTNRPDGFDGSQFTIYQDSVTVDADTIVWKSSWHPDLQLHELQANATYFFADSLKIVGLGQFPGFPFISYDGTDKGLFYDPQSEGLLLINGNGVQGDYTTYYTGENQANISVYDNTIGTGDISSLFDMRPSTKRNRIELTASGFTNPLGISRIWQQFNDTINYIAFGHATVGSIPAAYVTMGIGGNSSNFLDKSNKHKFSVQYQKAPLNNPYLLIEAGIPATSADTTDNEVKFYNGSYALKNARPSATVGDTSLHFWAGNGTDTDPGFMLLNDIRASAPNIYNTSSQQTDNTRIDTIKQTIEFTRLNPGELFEPGFKVSARAGTRPSVQGWYFNDNADSILLFKTGGDIAFLQSESMPFGLTARADYIFLDGDSIQLNFGSYEAKTTARYLLAGTAGANSTVKVFDGDAASSGDIITSNGTDWVVSSPSALGYILQDGNSFGAAVTIGSNDNFGFNLETNGVTRLNIGSGATTGGEMIQDVITANTATVTDAYTIRTNSSGVAASGFGGGLLFQGESTTTDNRDMGYIRALWQIATDGTRRSNLSFGTVQSGTFSEGFRLNSNIIQPTSGGSIILGGTSGLVAVGNSSGLVSINTTANSTSAVTIEASNNNTGTSGTIGNTGFSTTSGTKYDWRMSSGFQPTSGTGLFYNLLFNGIINQTGGANGATGAIIFSPTFTSVGSKWSALTYAGSNANALFINQTGSLSYSTHVGAFGFGSTTVPTDKVEVTGNIALLTAGNKIKIASGADASVGTATLSSGTITVNTTAVTASSLIFVTCNTPGGTQGFLSVPTASITAGTSFVINSSSGTDTSTVNWWIIN